MKTTTYVVMLLATLLVVSVGISAQQTEQKKEKQTVFSGKVMRSDTKKGVPNVKILLMDENKSQKQDNSIETQTNEDGNFTFSDIKPGKYTIAIRAYFDREEDVPCQLLMGKINEPNSKLIVATENNRKVEQIFIEGFSVKAGKEIRKEFDLVCKSLFSK